MQADRPALFVSSDLVEARGRAGHRSTIVNVNCIASASVNINADTGLVDQVTLDNATSNHDGDVIAVASSVGQDLADADAAAQGDAPGIPAGR